MTSSLQAAPRIRGPIGANWTTPAGRRSSARSLCERLASIEPTALADVTPAMAAAAAELALLAGIPWRFGADDPPIALLRMIARAALVAPDAGGPHCDRLADELDSTPRPVG